MSKKSLTTIIVILLVLVAALALNPSAEKHRNAIRDAISEKYPIAGMLGIGTLASFASNYHSYGVFSYTSENDRVISFGAFGVVHVIRRSREE